MENTPKRRWFQFSLRTAIVFMLFAASALGGGVFWYKRIHDATVKVDNQTGKNISIFVEWKSSDSRTIVSKQDVQLAPNSKTSFSFSPQGDYVVGSIDYDLGNTTERQTLLHLRMFPGETRGFRILSDGTHEYVSEDYHPPTR